MSYRCSVCDEIHDDLPHLGSDRPDMWWGIPKEERGRRIELTSDTCIIDGEDFFLRGVIELPIHDAPSPFTFGVWVSQSRASFLEYLQFPDSATIGPFFGWLCTRIDYYPEETLFLKTMAHFRDGNLRPAILLEPTDHPLAVDQREGITLEKAWEIVHHYKDRS
jgi:hypothetical protein